MDEIEEFYISSEYIFGMALPKKEIVARLEEVTRPLAQHLIKTLLWPESEYAAHWRQEIYNFLHNVSKLKGSNKFPSAEFIYRHTIGCNTDLISVWYQHIVEDYAASYGEPRCGFDECSVTDYFRWIASELSTMGEVSRSAVYRTLTNLMS